MNRPFKFRILLFLMTPMLLLTGDAGCSAAASLPSRIESVTGMVLIKVPAGRFIMGTPFSEKGRRRCEGPLHCVVLKKAFYMGECEVLWREYALLMNALPASGGRADLPVEKISFDKAMEFCRRMTVADGRAGNIPAGWICTLPSEAQWEYACRAGSLEPRYGPLDEVARYCDNSSDGGLVPRLNKKATRKANRFGLFDMIGNVWEWCLDNYHPSYLDSPCDGRAWLEPGSERRVVRGGSYRQAQGFCRAGARMARDQGRITPGQGFRVVVVPPCYVPGAENGNGDEACDDSMPGEAVKPRPIPGGAVVGGARTKRKAGSAMTDGLSIKLLWVPPGRLKSADKKEDIVIKKGFWMSAFEVTQKQWTGLMHENNSFFKGDSRPVDNVSLNDARAFCKALSKREGAHYRLPTQDEWEYACRAGGRESFQQRIDSAAWHQLNSGASTKPVGRLRPNAWGFFDMLGNVQEWCDDFSNKPRGVFLLVGKMGPARVSASTAVLRGGGFDSPPVSCNCSRRNRHAGGKRYYSYGFRVVRDED